MARLCLWVQVSVCVYLTSANCAYSWTCQSKMFMHINECMLKDLLWLLLFTNFEKLILLTALFYATIDCWFLIPLNPPFGATSDRQLLQFGIFFPTRDTNVPVTSQLRDSFVGIFTVKLTFTALFWNPAYCLLFIPPLLSCIHTGHTVCLHSLFHTSIPQDMSSKKNLNFTECTWVWLIFFK